MTGTRHYKIHTRILDDLWPQVTRIHGSCDPWVFPRVYLWVPTEDPDSCSALVTDHWYRSSVTPETLIDDLPSWPNSQHKTFGTRLIEHWALSCISQCLLKVPNKNPTGSDVVRGIMQNPFTCQCSLFFIKAKRWSSFSGKCNFHARQTPPGDTHGTSGPPLTRAWPFWCHM